MMLPLNSCSLSSPRLPQYCGIRKKSKALQVTIEPVSRTLSRGHVWKVRPRCFQALQKIDLITNRSDKSFRGKYICAHLEKGYALESKEEGDSTRFENFLWKKLKTFYTFTRPYAMAGIVIQAMTAFLLPVQTIQELSPAFFGEIFKALAAVILVNIYVAGINQLNDVEIDKINKPYLPLASGDFSIETGVAITFAALATSLVMGMMLSPSLFYGFLAISMIISIYSIDHPLLRWKKHPTFTLITNIFGGTVCPLAYFTHSQRFVLGKPIMVSKSLVFAIASTAFFFGCFVLFKDFTDEEGDKEFGIETLSIKLGKENLFWLGIRVLLTGYGAAMLVGATLSSLPNRIITIIGHFFLASLALFRAQSTDLTNEASAASFYMFIWKLFSAECLLTLFVR